MCLHRYPGSLRLWITPSETAAQGFERAVDQLRYPFPHTVEPFADGHAHQVPGVDALADDGQLVVTERHIPADLVDRPGLRSSLGVPAHHLLSGQEALPRPERGLRR